VNSGDDGVPYVGTGACAAAASAAASVATAAFPSFVAAAAPTTGADDQTCAFRSWGDANCSSASRTPASAPA